MKDDLEMLRLTGMDVVREAATMYQPGGFSYWLNYSCTGILPVTFLVVAVLAYPGRLRFKMRGIALGVPLLSGRDFTASDNAAAPPVIIINQKLDAAILTKTGEIIRDVRTDQLVFIRNAVGLEALAPGGTNSFNNGATAEHARVWYGHALRTDAAGTDGADGVGEQAVDHEQQEHRDGHGDHQFEDREAVRFVFFAAFHGGSLTVSRRR